VLGVGLGLRVALAWFVVGPEGTPDSGAAAIDRVAWNLARGLGFTLDAPAGTQPTALVPPVVPWLTSLLYRAAGHQFFAAVLLQCLVGALIPLLAAALGRSLFGDPVGRWAAWIAAVDPLLVRFSAELRTETAFAAALLLALCLGAEWVRAPRGGRALGLGLVWGVTSLTASTALALAPVIAAWAWPPLGLTVGGRARGRQIALLLLGLCAVVGPWTLRNAVALRAFVPVTTDTGRALWMGNSPAAWDDPARRGGADAEAGGDPAAGDRSGEVEADARARSRAWAFARGRVEDWPAIAAAKLARFWWPGSGDADRRPVRPEWWRAALDPFRLWSLVLFPFVLWGVARSLRGERRWFQALPLLVVVAFMGVAVAFHGSARVRLAVEPVLAVLAAFGLEQGWRRWRVRRGGLALVPQGRREEPGTAKR
jgi:4-amino-4-deoxy-L-arabinose transferase-like glycosyltransferase